MTAKLKTTNNLSLISNLTKAIDFNHFDTIDELLVIIPCFNEAKNIEQTVDALLKEGAYHFLIVDDASTDNLVEICERHQWKYLRNEKNLGLSKSFRIGVEYAIQNNYKYVLEFDGDGQFNAIDIPKLFFFAKKGYDIVTSSRFNTEEENFKFKKKVGDKFLNTLFLLKTHNKITDATCRMRLYNWSAMEVYVAHPRLEVEVASIAHMVRKYKMKIVEVPTYVYHRQYQQDEKKKQHGFGYTLRQMFKLMVA